MESKICPYLGLINDPNTGTSFPDGANACYQAKPAALVVLDYQHSTCLQAAHKECPGYIHAWRDGFPKSIRRRNSIINPEWFEGLAWLLVAIPVVLFIWAGFTGRLSFLSLDFRPGAVITPTSRPFFTRTPTETFTPTMTSTFSRTPTKTPTPTQTLTRTATVTRTITPTPTSTRFFWFIPTNTPVPTSPPSEPQPTQPPPTQRPPIQPPPPTQTNTPTNTPSSTATIETPAPTAIIETPDPTAIIETPDPTAIIETPDPPPSDP